MKQLFKIIGFSILSVFLAICIGINAWYLIIYNRGEKKTVINTYKIGMQERVEDTNGDGVIDDTDEVVESKPFVEVLYNTNDEGNGLELFEVKFNYFMDENRTGYYSQTLQFVSGYYDGTLLTVKDLLDNYAWRLESKENWSYSHKEGNWMFSDHYWNCFVYGRPDSAHGINNYMGDGDTYVRSTNELNENCVFRIQIGEDVYALGFVGKSAGYEKATDSQGYRVTTWDRINTYYTLDPYFFARTLYYSIVDTLANGTHRMSIYEIGDLFTYQKYNATTNTYLPIISPSETDLVRTHVFTYMGVEISKNASGTQKSEDSLSGIVSGSENLNVSEDMVIEDYFIGRVLTNFNLSNFIIDNYEDTKVKLKLNAYTLDNYGSVSDQIYVDILIDLDEITKEGYTFSGFAEDSGLDEFNIRSCKTVETVNGELVYTEVAYA